MKLPFVESIPAHVALDPIGRLVYTGGHGGGVLPGGASSAGPAPVLLAQRADYPAFMRWLQRGLDEAALPAARVPAGDERARAGA